MPDRRLSNARIQGWLAEDLDQVARQTGSSKVLVNSAAVWWFCHRIPAEERARLLGEFVTAQKHPMHLKMDPKAYDPDSEVSFEILQQR